MRGGQEREKDEETRDGKGKERQGTKRESNGKTSKKSRVC